MMKRMIVSTSTSCLDVLNKPDNVKMLRMHIGIGDIDYLDFKTIDPETIASLMQKNPNILPTSAPPTEETLINFFYNLVKEGVEEVLVVCLSSKMSATYNRIQSLQDFFAVRIKIHLFDTKTTTYGEAVLALAASKMLDNNLPIPQIIQRLTQLRDKQVTMFALDDLRNLVRTKRISAPAGFIGNLFDIKPILEINDKGEIVPFDKIRHIYKALDRMCQHIYQLAKNDPTVSIFLLSATKGHNELLTYMQSFFASRGMTDLPVMPISTVSIAIVGYRGVGIGLIAKED